MGRMKLFIICISNAFIALFNPKYVSQIFKDHNHMEKKRKKKERKKWEKYSSRM